MTDVNYTPEFDPADVDTDYGHTGGDIPGPVFTANTQPFKFWCQKALPLVYDDSLSYYEVLCKVVSTLVWKGAGYIFHLVHIPFYRCG